MVVIPKNKSYGRVQCFFFYILCFKSNTYRWSIFIKDFWFPHFPVWGTDALIIQLAWYKIKSKVRSEVKTKLSLTRLAVNIPRVGVHSELQTHHKKFYKFILMENVKPLLTSMYKAWNTCTLKFKIEASHILKKYLSQCIYVYIYTVNLFIILSFNFKSSL